MEICLLCKKCKNGRKKILALEYENEALKPQKLCLPLSSTLSSDIRLSV